MNIPRITIGRKAMTAAFRAAVAGILLILAAAPR
jgi:hypothetical protein